MADDNEDHDRIIVPPNAYRGEDVARTDSAELERLIKLGEQGKLALEDAKWLQDNGHFTKEAFKTVPGRAPVWSRAAQAFKLVPVAPKNQFEEMSKEMEKDY